MDAYKIVTQVLAKHLGCEAVSFPLETKLEWLGIDYLENIEIVMELEDTSGIDLNPRGYSRTVGDLVKLLVQGDDCD